MTIGKDLPGWGTSASIETRVEFWSKTLRATQDEALAGTGIGTFQQVYRRYENPGAVDQWYANHAHNDYLEIALEGGLPAIILLALFFAWWLRQGREAWLTPAGTPEQKAAAVASAAILLHSSLRLSAAHRGDRGGDGGLPRPAGRCEGRDAQGPARTKAGASATPRSELQSMSAA